MEKSFEYLRLCSFILCLSTIHAASNGDYNLEKLKTVFAWKSLDFTYPNAAARQQEISSGQFNEGAIIPIDVDVLHGPSESKIFVAIPRFQSGVPATLGIVTSLLSAKGDPLIAPYPNWEWNRLGDCNHLTSVFRIAIDDCDRIWVLDTGKVLEQQVCPAQLLVFSSLTDQLLSRYKFPSSQVTQGSLFIAPIVDVINKQNQCLDTFVYIMDVDAYQLLVYDHKQKTSWNIRDKVMYPYPNYGTHTINGLSFDLMDGIFSATLSPIQSDGHRILHFHSFASVSESWVSTEFIKNGTAFSHSQDPAPQTFHTFTQTRPGEASVEVMNKEGVLFYGMVPETSLGCWNSVTHPNYGGSNLERLVTSPTAIPFISGMKIKEGKQGTEELWMMTVPFAKYMNGVIDPSILNFRILGAYVNELIRGTKCDISQRPKSNAKPCKPKVI